MLPANSLVVTAAVGEFPTPHLQGAQVPGELREVRAEISIVECGVGEPSSNACCWCQRTSLWGCLTERNTLRGDPP